METTTTQRRKAWTIPPLLLLCALGCSGSSADDEADAAADLGAEDATAVDVAEDASGGDVDVSADADADADGDDVPPDEFLPEAVDVEEDAPDDGGPTCTFAPRDAAFILYYGVMRDEDGVIRDDLTFLLANPGLDVTFTIGGNGIFGEGEPSAPGEPGTGHFKDYHDHCLRLAYHMGIGQVIACLAQRSDLIQGTGDGARDIRNLCEDYRTTGSEGSDDLAAFWQAKLDLGWDYIAIDEIKELTLHTAAGDERPVNLTNDHTDLRRFVAALEKLATLRPDYDKRVFVFFAPHADAGPAAVLPDYSDLFAACMDHCRTVMHEMYLDTSEVVVDGKWTAYDAIATELHRLGLPGINRVTTAIIAVGNDPDADTPWVPFDDAECDISPWDSVAPGYPTLRCPHMPDSGGVARQLSAMHAGDYSRYWWGVGFYKIGAVRSKTGYWTKEDFVRSTAQRVDWWATHSPP